MIECQVGSGAPTAVHLSLVLCFLHLSESERARGLTEGSALAPFRLHGAPRVSKPLRHLLMMMVKLIFCLTV